MEISFNGHQMDFVFELLIKRFFLMISFRSILNVRIVLLNL